MGKQLTLEEKVGQLMMFGFADRNIPLYIREFITEYNLGGIIHFSRNIKNAEQIKMLNEELQELAASHGRTRLLISLDQEGGSVARLTKGVSTSPGNMALGATGNKKLVEQCAAVMGEELRAVGFNVNLAPAVDVNNNGQNPVIGVRSFGAEPQLVSELGSAAIKGFQKHLLAVAKHFPGHGDTHTDSHFSMPVIEHDWARLNQVELPPFRAAIKSGVAGILTSHLMFPALESNPRLPATLSYNVLTKLLREELGFQGLIFTDCMEMEAITKQYTMSEAVVLAIQAGVDIFLVSHTWERQKEAFTALVAAVKEGVISEARLDESLARIARAKEMLDETENMARTLNQPEQRAVMEQVAAEAITLVQDRGNLPLKEENLIVIETKAQATSIAEDVIEDGTTLARALIDAGFSVHREQIDLTPSEAEQKRLVQLTENQPLVIIVSQDAHRHRGQAELIRKINASAREVIVVGARTPYEFNAFPEVATYLAVYSNRDVVWGPLVKVLTGKLQPQGKLPVSL